jgi:hypothetical protein
MDVLVIGNFILERKAAVAAHTENTGDTSKSSERAT